MTASTEALIHPTPLGPVHLVATARGLTHVWFATDPTPPPQTDDSAAAQQILQATTLQLSEYFEGRRQAFDLPLDPTGTEFQRAVWKSLEKIPWGQTVSYGQVARQVGRPTAVRAVGAANAANPIPIIVPCHRVIGATGQLTGYRGGVPIKRQLLTHEGILLQGDRLSTHEAPRPA